MFREEVPEKARPAYGMGCGGVDMIPQWRSGPDGGRAGSDPGGHGGALPARCGRAAA